MAGKTAPWFVLLVSLIICVFVKVRGDKVLPWNPRTTSTIQPKSITTCGLLVHSAQHGMPINPTNGAANMDGLHFAELPALEEKTLAESASWYVLVS